MLYSGVGFSAGVIASVILFRRAYTPPITPSNPAQVRNWPAQDAHGPSHSARASAQAWRMLTATARSTLQGYLAHALCPPLSSKRSRHELRVRWQVASRHLDEEAHEAPARSTETAEEGWCNIDGLAGQTHSCMSRHVFSYAQTSRFVLSCPGCMPTSQL